MKLKKYQLIYTLCIFTIFLQQTFLGMDNSEIIFLDLNKSIEGYEDLEDGLNPEIKKDVEDDLNPDGCDDISYIDLNQFVESLICENCEDGLNPKNNNEVLNDTDKGDNQELVSKKTKYNDNFSKPLEPKKLLNQEKNKKTILNKKRKISLNDQTVQSKRFFNEELNITFKKKYFLRLFGKNNSIKDAYHCVPPQLIACMIRYAKKRQHKNTKIREVFGIVCNEDNGKRASTYKVKCARIVTDKNGVIFHIGFEDSVIKPSIFDPISILYRHIVEDSNKMNFIFKNNSKYFANIPSQKDTVLIKNNLLRGDGKTVTRSVNELSDLGNFPNKIMNGNDFIDINENTSVLCFPISHTRPKVFLTTEDWITQEDVEKQLSYFCSFH